LKVGVLLMDESGSVGLDLSFVSYVLMLEPIADLSMEEQVVSRAHRMGAVAPILVQPRPPPLLRYSQIDATQMING
jgi:SNF2 family DNA or RNA helicase